METALKDHPDVFKVFFSYGMTCICCKGAALEPIDRGAMIHGVDVESFLKDINSLAG